MITGLSIRAVYNAINEEKPLKKSVQKPTEKNIKYHVFNPLFCANSYQCSVLLVKELRSNSHLVCERSEPKLFFKPLSLKISNTPTVKHPNIHIPFVLLPQITQHQIPQSQIAFVSCKQHS